MGEKKTLRLVAKYADACNLFYRGDMGALHSKLDVLKRHCEAEGRAYEDIERTVLTGVHLGPGAMGAAQVVEMCRSLAENGIQHLIVNMPDVYEIRPLEVFGREIIPAVASIT
jgi:alkanesulfonate monooxygenase